MSSVYTVSGRIQKEMLLELAIAMLVSGGAKGLHASFGLVELVDLTQIGLCSILIAS